MSALEDIKHDAQEFAKHLGESVSEHTKPASQGGKVHESTQDERDVQAKIAHSGETVTAKTHKVDEVVESIEHAIDHAIHG